MDKEIVQRSTLVVSALALFALVVSVLRKATTVTASDPLKDSGLTEVELRTYRYLLALQTLSKYNPLQETNLSAEKVRKFIADNHAAVCTHCCGRWFLAEVMYCPYHHVPSHEVNDEEFQDMINKWEVFRREYSEKHRTKGLTRVLTIKLHYYYTHRGEQYA